MNNAVLNSLFSAIKNSLTLNHNYMMTECKVFVVHKTIINLSSGKYGKILVNTNYWFCSAVYLIS